MNTDRSVLVGMSGGIDSTAVCCMLLEQGYRVEGLTFVTCDSGFGAVDAAAALAARLGIKHHLVDVRDEFRQLVVQPFIDVKFLMERALKRASTAPLIAKKSPAP